MIAKHLERENGKGFDLCESITVAGSTDAWAITSHYQNCALFVPPTSQSFFSEQGWWFGV